MNIASRIQEFNIKLDSDIFISETTQLALNKEIPVKKLPTIKVKGKIEPASVFKFV